MAKLILSRSDDNLDVFLQIPVMGDIVVDMTHELRIWARVEYTKKKRPEALQT